jgi:hypothetical protein
MAAVYPAGPDPIIRTLVLYVVGIALSHKVEMTAFYKAHNTMSRIELKRKNFR